MSKEADPLIPMIARKLKAFAAVLLLALSFCPLGSCTVVEDKQPVEHRTTASLFEAKEPASYIYLWPLLALIATLLHKSRFSSVFWWMEGPLAVLTACAVYAISIFNRLLAAGYAAYAVLGLFLMLWIVEALVGIQRRLGASRIESSAS